MLADVIADVSSLTTAQAKSLFCIFSLQCHYLCTSSWLTSVHPAHRCFNDVNGNVTDVCLKAGPASMHGPIFWENFHHQHELDEARDTHECEQQPFKSLRSACSWTLQGCIKLIKSDNKDIYLSIIDLYFNECIDDIKKCFLKHWLSNWIQK